MTTFELFNDMYKPYFSFHEFACKCGNCISETPEWFCTPEFKAFMKKLMYMRAELGFPFSINSGYRCSDYNDSLYKSDLTHLHGPHTIGAADIRASFERSYQIIKLATSMDMGVGPTQHGKVDDRFIHVDNMGTRFWTY